MTGIDGHDAHAVGHRFGAETRGVEDAAVLGADVQGNNRVRLGSQAAIGIFEDARGRRGCAGEMGIGLQAIEEFSARYIDAFLEAVDSKTKQAGDHRNPEAGKHLGWKIGGAVNDDLYGGHGDEGILPLRGLVDDDPHG